MNHADIVSHLVDHGYTANLSEDGTEISVDFLVGECQGTLIHQFPERIVRLPAFELVDASTFGKLAHVVVQNNRNGRGTVCVQDPDSVSVNYEVPKLAYEESLRRHLTLIRSLIEEPDWNQQELIREFHSNWDLLCSQSNKDELFLFTGNDTNSPSALQIRCPAKKSLSSIQRNYFALTPEQENSKAFEVIRTYARWSSRQAIGKALLVSLCHLEPAPGQLDELADWYLNALNHLVEDDRNEFERIRKHPGKDFWLVFQAKISNGNTSFAIRFSNNKKVKLPNSKAECERWTIKPYGIRSLSRDALLTRGGGSIDLSTKSVLLVGCGSVGSEIAHRLAAAGVGNLTITDPQLFHEHNLYRHTLAIGDIDFLKSLAVARDLQLKHPGILVTPLPTPLAGWTSREALDHFDLIVIAIGAPTEERVFHDDVQRIGFRTPVMNTWVEAYGVGGHTILDLPLSKGCFRCAYVDVDTLSRGLASNLNFLEPNQNVTTTHAGCGHQFLPYSGISASYTATMTADLATQFLCGKVNQSSKVSWKGCAIEAEERGFKTNHRYQHFTKTLEILPLLNSECDVCSD